MGYQSTNRRGLQVRGCDCRAEAEEVSFQGKAAAAKHREKFKGKTGEVMDTPGRTMRQSSRKMVAEDLMDVDDESEDEDETGDMAEDEEAEDSTQPKLAPASQFSSFILWHPVIPVEAGKDEYNEAILEWMNIMRLSWNG
ncbi:hypothetical protein PQX77_011645 [Marasmius sp. AFHP31]|nr:hypothetical protein PQX77_011645 [Marasmius sp. AFHP31]